MNVILIGEAFRYGGQGNRTRDLSQSYDGQIKACNTHKNFFIYLEDKFKININLYINVYETKYKNDILNIYSNFVKYFNFPTHLKSLTGLVKEIYPHINDKTLPIFICRIDLFLKPYFFEIFNPNLNKITFPSICFVPHHKIHNLPRINDMMMFIPSNYFFIFENFNFTHDSCYELIKSFPNKLNSDSFSFLLNTYHDSDSFKDYNPLYQIVNRNKNKKWHTKGYIYDKISFEPIKSDEYFDYSDG